MPSYAAVSANPSIPPSSVRWGVLVGGERITRPSRGGARTAIDLPALRRSDLRGETGLDGLITQRIARKGSHRGFADLKAGRAIRSVIVYGDAA